MAGSSPHRSCRRGKNCDGSNRLALENPPTVVLISSNRSVGLVCLSIGPTCDQNMEIPEIARTVRQVLLEGVLNGTDPKALQDTTPLLTGGMLDSIRTMTLISDLERKFNIRFEAFEASVDYLDSILQIARTIRGKQVS